ncbi:GMC family oxidoreductase [Aureibacter tunicatorum]|uniref:Choline dehydrogenase-like flavoprotein n=1 Tax=Aureibacter tunicatorum TaxID=866807 RepID=A0AAE3XKX3_9BACT|nr:GMC family oxidoreductase [Aureibacter tunicatorum]MDR6239736.1 choline dehydrogenase-like flavoprotein [Aureibacter tunicatorum]BDD04212.1 dehydrogenase [Aureibacter tunicatorum]
MNKDYDVIIVGTGAGGGTLLHKLAKENPNLKILILERGSFLPREKENWNSISVFQNDRYHTKEKWYDKNENPIHPGTGYWVGGNTKVYGAALFRLRENDFNEVKHQDGVSPVWPLKYSDFEPYYDEAEKLYNVHGLQGIDASEPRIKKYHYPPVQHETRIQEVHDKLKDKGLNPFYIPLGVKLNEENELESQCIKCNTCDGFPCLIHAKADSDINCVRPSLKKDNITLITEAKVTKLHTTTSGDTINKVEFTKDGEIQFAEAKIVVVSCGAINSAVLLLNSANEKHPNGLANSSDLVGRNFMKHNNGAILGLSDKPNPTSFQKTLAVNDFYWGDKDYKYPMGHVQLLGKVDKDMLGADAPSFAPGFVLEQMATHSIDWWLTNEDLPDLENRVFTKNGKIHLVYKDNNQKSFQKLMDKWTKILKSIDCANYIVPHSLYFKKKIPLQAVGHQCGTMRFGEDPKESVLDVNCKAHDLTNLYVVDGSFFPSSGAVNPSLTIIANALRVAKHISQHFNS